MQTVRVNVELGFKPFLGGVCAEAKVFDIPTGLQIAFVERTVEEEENIYLCVGPAHTQVLLALEEEYGVEWFLGGHIGKEEEYGVWCMDSDSHESLLEDVFEEAVKEMPSRYAVMKATDTQGNYETACTCKHQSEAEQIACQIYSRWRVVQQWMEDGEVKFSKILSDNDGYRRMAA